FGQRRCVRPEIDDIPDGGRERLQPDGARDEAIGAKQVPGARVNSGPIPTRYAVVGYGEVDSGAASTTACTKGSISPSAEPLAIFRRKSDRSRRRWASRSWWEMLAWASSKRVLSAGVTFPALTR